MPKTIEQQIGDRKVLFKVVTRRIKAAIEEQARRWYKARKADSLGNAGYPPEAIAEKLCELDSQQVDMARETIPYLNTTDGADLALEFHLANPEEAERIDDIEDPGTLLRELWGGLLVPKAIETPKESEAEADDPTIGATFGPTNPPPTQSNGGTASTGI